MQSVRYFKHIFDTFCHFGGGGGPEKKLDILVEIQKKNGNFQIFTHPPLS